MVRPRRRPPERRPRADLAVIDPIGFDGSSAEYAEAPYPGADGVTRMVNRNDRAVTAMVVGGNIVYADGQFAPGFGITFLPGNSCAHKTIRLRFMPAGTLRSHELDTRAARWV